MKMENPTNWGKTQELMYQMMLSTDGVEGTPMKELTDLKYSWNCRTVYIHCSWETCG